MNTCKSNEKLNNNCDIAYQSFGLVLRFIQHVIQLKNDDCIVLYPKIIFHIFHWSQSLDLHHQSMLILQTIIINVRNYNSCLDQNLQCDILEKLEGSLDVSIMCFYILSLYNYLIISCSIQFKNISLEKKKILVKYCNTGVEYFILKTYFYQCFM